MELYLHIPFCVRKCAYCDFLSSPATEETMEAYLRALFVEMNQVSEQLRKRNEKASTVFIGGGTPSCLSASMLERLLFQMKTLFQFEEDCEYTIEANPGTLTEEKLTVLQAGGINRLSIGLQSANEQELKMLGRIHTFEEFEGNFALARKIGFQNINVDLMMGLPGQTVEDHLQTLQKVAALYPEHLSVYNLIVEEGTLFGEGLDAAGKKLPAFVGEEADRILYKETKSFLFAQGYTQYEISNYAKDHYACRHNIGYWTGESYIGLGLGASSYHDQDGQGMMRYHNTRSLKQYIEGAFFGEVDERVDEVTAQEEFCFLGLRMMEGIAEEVFQNRFHKKIDDIYGDVIDHHIENGLLQRKQGRISLTEEGIFVSNIVMADFLQ